MQIDPALVAALRRADATGNVAELHPDNVWKPRMIEEAPKDVSAFVPASAGYAYTEWDLVRRSRASLGVGGIVGFCIGFALAVLVCWQAWGNG